MRNRKSLFILGFLVLVLLSSSIVVFAVEYDGDTTLPIRQRLGWKLGFGRDNITDGKYATTLTEDDLVTIEGVLEEDIDLDEMPYIMKVQSNETTYAVHLGRIVFYDSFKGLKLEKGSDVKVSGIERTFTINDEEENIFVPFTINDVPLRDEDNRPIWAGQRGQGGGMGRGVRGNANQGNTFCQGFNSWQQ